MNRYPTYVLATNLDLAGVDTEAQRDAEIRDLSTSRAIRSPSGRAGARDAIRKGDTETARLPRRLFGSVYTADGFTSVPVLRRRRSRGSDGIPAFD